MPWCVVCLLIPALIGLVVPPLRNFLPLSASKKSCPTEVGTPTFLANLGFLATAAMKLCCFLLVDGTFLIPYKSI